MINFVNKYINILFALAFGIILVLVVLLGGFVPYGYKRYFPAALDISFFLIVIFGIFRVSKSIINNRGNIKDKFNNINFDKAVMLTSVGLFCYHMLLLAFVGVVSAYDSSIIEVDANLIANGNVTDLNNDYFSIYPNNLLITLLQSAIIKFNNFLGLFDNGLVLFVIINSIICVVTIMMMYSILKRFLEKKYAFIGFIIGAISFGISPWVLTTYSDPIGLLIPTLLLYIYLIKPKNIAIYALKFAGIIVIASIAYTIKPQVYVMFIAIIMYECVRLIQTKKIQKIILILPILFSSAICLSTVQDGVITAANNVGYEIDTEQSFGIQHWFMMGLGDKTTGGYSSEDFEFSASFDNKEDRNQANMEEAMNRLKDMGLIGTTVHMVQKLLMNFNDGSFTLYMAIVYELNVFGVILLIIEQILWLLILGLCFAGALFGLNKFKSDSYEELDDETISVKTIVMLSILGLTMMVMLFEGRARYLYTFAPIFAIMATFGAKALFEHLEKNDQIIAKYDQTLDKYNGPMRRCILSVGASLVIIVILIAVAIVFMNFYLTDLLSTLYQDYYDDLSPYGTLPELINLAEIAVIALVSFVVLLNITTSVFTILHLTQGKFKKTSGVLNIVILLPFNVIAGILILESDE